MFMDKHTSRKCTKKMLVIIFPMNILFYQTRIQIKRRILKQANCLKRMLCPTPGILSINMSSFCGAKSTRYYLILLIFDFDWWFLLFLYQRFQMLTGIEQGIQLCDFHKFEGQSVHVQEAKYKYFIPLSNRLQIILIDFIDCRLQLHGFNTMSVDVKSYWRLLIDEVLNPFYLFEIFSCVVWTVDDYIYYAACIFVVSIISVGVALYEIRRVT